MNYIKFICFFAILAWLLSGCSANISGPVGPDSGEEVDLGPDSGDEVDPNEPQGPDSGDEEAVEPEPSSPDSGDEIDTSEDGDDDDGDQPTSPDSGDEEDVSEDEDEPDDDSAFGGKGSCEDIGDSSICVTYVGSYWKDDTMKLHCSVTGTFSKKSCPTDSLGGCKVGVGTPNENIIWHYGRGGQPFTEVIGYAAKSCTAIPGTAWVGR